MGNTEGFPLRPHPNYCLHSSFQVMKLGKWDLVYQIPSKSRRCCCCENWNPHLSKEQRVSSQWQNGGGGGGDAEWFCLIHESTSVYSNTPTPKHTHTHPAASTLNQTSLHCLLNQAFLCLRGSLNDTRYLKPWKIIFN